MSRTVPTKTPQKQQPSASENSSDIAVTKVSQPNDASHVDDSSFGSKIKKKLTEAWDFAKSDSGFTAVIILAGISILAINIYKRLK